MHGEQGFGDHLRHVSEQREEHSSIQWNSDLEWRATPESRLTTLDQLKDKQNKQLQSYGWTDQKAGAVQLPIDRAEELIIAQYRTSSK